MDDSRNGWRLENGSVRRDTWHYLWSDAECEWPQPDIHRPILAAWLALLSCTCVRNAPALALTKDPFEAASNGLSIFKRLQAHDSQWPRERGPTFVLPRFVIGSYASGLWFEEEERLEMIRYLFNRVHPDDGMLKAI